MQEYYCFQTATDAQVCVNYINTTPWFPIIGLVNGQPAPNNERTTMWIEAPLEMVSGEWAVPRIPEYKLNLLGIPEDTRDDFLSAFGQDIRTLDCNDFLEKED